MKVEYSEYIRWGEDPVRNIDAMLAQHPDGLEFFLEGPGWEEDPAIFDRVAVRLAGWDGNLSLHPPSWDINLASPTRAIRQTALAETRRSIDMAQRLGAQFLVVHTGWYGEKRFPRSRCKELVSQGIDELVPYARERGVALGIENVGWFGAGVFAEDEYVDLIGSYGAGTFALVDVGHANLQGWDPAALIARLGGRLGAVHLHGNHGESDEHLPVEHGRMDWPAIWQALCGAPANCGLVLEYRPGTDLAELATGHRIVRQRLEPFDDGR